MNMNINEFESLKNYNEDNLSKRLIQAGLWLIIIATSAIYTQQKKKRKKKHLIRKYPEQSKN